MSVWLVWVCLHYIIIFMPGDWRDRAVFTELLIMNYEKDIGTIYPYNLQYHIMLSQLCNAYVNVNH